MRKAARISLALALPALVLLAFSPASATEPKKHRLSNGVTVITAPHAWNRIVAATVLVDAGSRRDPAKRRGLAHITSELMLRGTESMSWSEMAELTDSSGIMLGSHTTEDYSEIYVTAIDSQLDRVVAILADVLARPTLDEEHLAGVQKKALDTVEMEQDDTFSRSYEKLSELLFVGHPYAFPVIGTYRGVESVTPRDVERFYEEHYRGGNTVIAIVGNFAPADALDALEEHLSDYPSGESERRPPGPIVKPKRRELEYYRDSSTGYIQIGYHVPPVTSSDYAPLAVLTSVLGDGTASRLYRALGPDGAGIAELAGSFYPDHVEQGRIVIYTESREVDEALAVIHGVVETLRTDAATPEELTRAKNRVKGRVVVKGERNIDQARRFAWSELMGLGLDHVQSFLREVEKVDAGDVQRVAREYLTDPVKVVQRPAKSRKKIEAPRGTRGI